MGAFAPTLTLSSLQRLSLSRHHPSHITLRLRFGGSGKRIRQSSSVAAPGTSDKLAGGVCPSSARVGGREENPCQLAHQRQSRSRSKHTAYLSNTFASLAIMGNAGGGMSQEWTSQLDTG